MFLRLAIEDKTIVAYVRDPETGDVLQLRSTSWIPGPWEDDIPAGIWSDYIHGDFESPGPEGTLIHGSLRPVFFLHSEFEAWVEKVFDTAAGLSAASSASPNWGTRKIDAAKEAVRSLWDAYSSVNGAGMITRVRLD